MVGWLQMTCRDFGFSGASVDVKRGEGSPGRQLDLETYLDWMLQSSLERDEPRLHGTLLL